MRRYGLTLLELVIVVLAIIILIAILMPAKGGSRVSLKALCGTHLKSQAMALAVYAAANADVLPTSNVKLPSMCAQWTGTLDAIVSAAQSAGLMSQPMTSIRKWFYCPANQAQDPAKLWEAGDVSTWGYVWMNERGKSAGLPTTFPARRVPLEYVSEFNNAPHPAETILAQDVVVTDTARMPLNYAPKRAAVGFGTNHLKNAQPNWVNVLHPDGSVESVPFDGKTAVAVPQPGGGYFWFPGP